MKMDDKSTIIESKLMSNHLSAPTPSQTSVLVTSTSTIASSSSRTSTIPSPTNLNNGNSISHKIESLVQTSSQPSSSSYFPTQPQAPMPNFNYNTNSNHFYPPNIMNYPHGPPLQQQQQQPHPPGLAMCQQSINASASANNYLFNANSMMYPQSQVPNMFNPMTNGLNSSGMTYPPQMLGTPGMPPQQTTPNSSLAQALATPPALMMPQHQQVMNASSSHLAPSHSPVRHLSTSSTSSSVSSPSHSSSSTKSTKMVNGNEETKKKNSKAKTKATKSPTKTKTKTTKQPKSQKEVSNSNNQPTAIDESNSKNNKSKSETVKSNENMNFNKNQKADGKDEVEHESDDEDSNEHGNENDDEDENQEETNEIKKDEEAFDDAQEKQVKGEKTDVKKDTNQGEELKRLNNTENRNDSNSHQVNSNEMNNKFLSIAHNNNANKSKSPSPTSFNICNILGESSEPSKSTNVHSGEIETIKTIKSPLNPTEQEQSSESSTLKSNESITNSHEVNNILPPPPPPPLASASLSTSSEPERAKTPHCETNIEKRMAPSTPNLDLTPQIGENSNMSFDDTSMTSDEPSSPKLSSSSSQSLSKSTASHNADILAKLVDMNTTDEVVLGQRKEFVNKLQKIWEDYGIQCRSLPNVSKQQLDLYKLYNMVKEKGGFNEVTKNKSWKDIALMLNIGASASAAFNVRKKYVSLGIFHFECKYDLNGTDPLPIIAEMEKAAAATKKPKANSNTNININNNNSNDSFNRPSTPSTPSSSVSNSNLTNSAKKKKKDKNQANTNPTSTQSPSTNNQPNVPGMNNPQNPMGMQHNQMHAPGLHYQNDHYHQQQQMHQIPNQQYPQYANQQYYGQPRPPYNAYQIPPNQVAPTHQMGMQPPPNQMAPNQQFMNQTQTQPGMMNYHQQPSQQPGQQQAQPIQRIYNDMYNSPQQQHQQQQPQQPQQPQQQAPQAAQFNQAVRYPAPTQTSSQQPFGPSGQPQQILHPNYQPYNQHAASFQPQLPPTTAQPQQPQQQQPQQYPQTNNTQAPPAMLNSQSAQANAQTQQAPHQMQSQQGSFNNNFNQPAGVASATLNRAPSVDDKLHLPQSGGQQGTKLQNGPQTPLRNSLNHHGQHHGHHSHHGHHGHHAHHHHHHVKPQTPNPTQMMMAQQKKEIIFPPDSVEAAQIVESKKRKITSKDLGPLDPWKLFMSLKSGLLAESTWALDALNILLYDDNTISYFHLKHFPGLLNVLLEHYLKCLKMIFDEKSTHEFADLHLNNEFQTDEQESSDDEELIKQASKQTSETTFSNKIAQNNKITDEEKQTVSSSSTVKKQVNGYNKKNTNKRNNSHHHHNNNNHVDNDEDHVNREENEDNIDKFKVLKLRLTDRDTRKRYFHFYRTVKFSDANVLEYLYDYNNYLIENLDKPNLKRFRRNAEKRKKQEFSDHILTNFNSNNDIATLEKLFYGSMYTERVQFYAMNPSQDLLEEETKTRTSHKESQKQKRQEKSSLNEEFIRRHRLKPRDTETSQSSSTAFEDRIQSEEESLFRIINQQRSELLNRCVCISTIIRNLSFVPGNDAEICKNELLMKILARLLVLKHTHKIIVNQNEKNTLDLNDAHHVDQHDTSMNNSDYSIDENLDDDVEFDCIRKVANKKLFFQINGKYEMSVPHNESRTTETEWWWDCVHALRENALVTVANIASSINLNNFDQDLIELFVHSLIHWSICKSFDAQDTLCTMSETSLLSAQRLAIETLSKMTITETNIDFFLVTLCSLRPYLEAFLHLLGAEWLTRRDDQTLREFAIVLLAAIAKGDQIAARLIAKYCSFLIAFIEDFEEHTRRNPSMIMNNNFNPNHISNNNSNNSNSNYPDSYSNLMEDNLGTTVDTLRRCSNCILYISMDSENIALIMKHESRLLDLITSQFVDYKVSQTLAEVLFYCSSATK